MAKGDMAQRGGGMMGGMAGGGMGGMGGGMIGNTSGRTTSLPWGKMGGMNRGQKPMPNPTMGGGTDLGMAPPHQDKPGYEWQPRKALPGMATTHDMIYAPIGQGYEDRPNFGGGMTNWDAMQRNNPDLAAKIPGGGISGGQQYGGGLSSTGGLDQGTGQYNFPVGPSGGGMNQMMGQIGQAGMGGGMGDPRAQMIKRGTGPRPGAGGFKAY